MRPSAPLPPSVLSLPLWEWPSSSDARAWFVSNILLPWTGPPLVAVVALPLAFMIVACATRSCGVRKRLPRSTSIGCALVATIAAIILLSLVLLELVLMLSTLTGLESTTVNTTNEASLLVCSGPPPPPAAAPPPQHLPFESVLTHRMVRMPSSPRTTMTWRPEPEPERPPRPRHRRAPSALIIAPSAASSRPHTRHRPHPLIHHPPSQSLLLNPSFLPTLFPPRSHLTAHPPPRSRFHRICRRPPPCASPPTTHLRRLSARPPRR